MTATVGPVPSDLVGVVKKGVAQRVRLSDLDPEAGHETLDDLCELVVKATAVGHPQAAEAAALVADLLSFEGREEWRRWYA